jgi:hypothetical protein
MPEGIGRVTCVTRFPRTADLSAGGQFPQDFRGLRFRRNSFRAAILAWVCIWTASTHAGQLNAGVGTSLAYETNIGRIETGAQPDWIQSLYGGVFYTENTEELKARAIAQLERRHFYRGTFSDDTTGYLDGAAIWSILPKRLNWGLDDVYREVLLDVTAPDTPSNRTQSNSLATGPDVTFAVSSANTVLFGARYGRFDIKDSNNDNQRYMGFVRGIHNTSPLSTVSLNYEIVKMYFEPDAQQFPKVLQQNLFGRWQTENAGNAATIDLGVTHVNRYTEEPFDGHIVRVTIARSFSVQSRVRFGYSDQISDTYSDQIRGISASAAPTDTAVVIAQGTSFNTGDLYRSKRGELGYTNTSGALTFSAVAFARSVDFFTIDDDYHEKGGRLGLNWFSGYTRANAFADYSNRVFPSLDNRVDILHNYGAGIDFRLNRNVTLSMSGNYAQQQSTAAGNSFVDQRVMVAVSYSTGAYELQSRR